MPNTVLKSRGLSRRYVTSLEGARKPWTHRVASGVLATLVSVPCVWAEGSAELRAWMNASAADDCAAYRDFLSAHPTGRLAALARARTESCRQPTQTPPQPTPATPPDARSQPAVTAQPGVTQSPDEGPRQERPAITRHADDAPRPVRPGPVITDESDLTPPPIAANHKQFLTTVTDDGFVAVREAPTTASGLVARLGPGQRIACERLVKGQAFQRGGDWAHCPSVGGYIYAPLLAALAADLSPQPRRRAKRTSDGFVAVRSAPSTRSGWRVAKLSGGDIIRCTYAVRGQRIGGVDRWVYCPDVGGFIHAPLAVTD